MYICECGAVFEEPRRYEEHHPYGMGYATEEFYECPVCREGHFEEATRCEVCGEWSATRICKDCDKEEE